jgi:prepilin signal peptidase PulO-like enzyme (type II secretory pathway)
MDTTVIAIGALVIVAIAVGIFVYWRGRPQQTNDEFWHFRCPKCRRRIRYQSRQIGHKGKCSNCNADLNFPPTSESVD